MIISAVVGARAAHVIANFGYYSRDPVEFLAIWHGGLSSFGGLALGLPVGFVSAHRRCPQLGPGVAADLVAPVLACAWAVGRLLGPQFELAGGGKPTSAWYGMYYAGEVGKRLPVPLFQAVECFAIFGVALWAERAVARRGGPIGVVSAVVVGLWGLSRFVDEYFWLTHDNGTDAVEIASLALLVAGGAAVIALMTRARRRRSNPPVSTESEPARSGTTT